MSLVYAPLLLFLLGMAVARLSKHRRIWRRHSLFTMRMTSVVVVLYTVLSLALLFDLPSVAGLVRLLPGDTGRELLLNGGLLHLDATWPLADQAVVAYVILSFMAFPLWAWLGVQTSYWLYGRSPKQTGILGLLR